MNFLRGTRPGSRPDVFALLEGATCRLHDAQSATLARQIAIAGVAAPTGREGARADTLARWLLAAGHTDVRRDSTGNVIARIAGRVRDATAQAPVVVMAHLDTVFRDETVPAVRREGSRIVMPGIGDNGRGLAALLTLADVLGDDDIAMSLRHPIELVATVGEEGAGNLRGAHGYFDDRAQAHQPAPVAVIALDGPGDTLIVHHAIASRRLRVTFVGAGGHPWADAGTANAVHAAGRAVAAIAQLADAQQQGVTITVTRLGGGESLTSIPAQAWFEIDLRSLHAPAIPRLHDAVRRLSERAITDSTRTRAGGDLSVSFETLGDRPGGSLAPDHPLVRLAAHATRWQGREPQSASASSDANVPLSRGISAITIGAGGMGGGAHTDHEWYDDLDASRGLARALGVIVSAARGAACGSASQ